MPAVSSLDFSIGVVEQALNSNRLQISTMLDALCSNFDGNTPSNGIGKA